MKPLEATLTVVRVAWKPFHLQLSTSSAYFVCFHDALSSIPVLNRMVSSTMWIEEAFQTTMSSHSSVTAMFWGKVYGLLGRSTLILLSWGKCEERKEWMQARTLSCLSLYRIFSRATSQLFSTWCRECSLLQSCHRGDGMESSSTKQVLVMWQCVGDGIQGKLDNVLWEMGCRLCQNCDICHYMHIIIIVCTHIMVLIYI